MMANKTFSVIQTIRAGWNLTKASWSLWLLLSLVSLLFLWLHQQVMIPGLSRLLPAIPPAALERVPVESYITLALEGGHEFLRSPLLHQMVLFLGLFTLLQLLLQPLLQLLVFSQLRQPQPTASFVLLWQRLSHRLSAFYAVTLVQFLLSSLLAGGVGWSLWLLANQLVMYSKLATLATILLLVVCAIFLFSWGFSFFTCWQVTLAEGDKLLQGAKRALHQTMNRAFGKSLLLPMVFWFLTTAVIACLQAVFLPSLSAVSAILATILQQFALLWLTYSLAAAYRRLQED